MIALIVGRGRMGRFHEKVLADLGYETVTVDPDPVTGADYASIAEARLAQRQLDVAAIATPAEHLADSAFQLAGIPMLVEKPFALTSKDAALLAAYLKQAGAPVCVGYVERFNPMVRKARAELLTLPPFGPVYATFARYSDRPSWNDALDLTSHDIDLALHTLRLALECCTFDTRPDYTVKARSITLTHDDLPVEFDLMDHDQSPLHALWHAFLTGRPVPTPSQAIAVLRVIEHMQADSPHREIAA